VVCGVWWVVGGGWWVVGGGWWVVSGGWWVVGGGWWVVGGGWWAVGGGGWRMGEWWVVLYGGRADALYDEQGDGREHHALTLDPQQRLEQRPSLQSALSSWQRRARWRARRRAR
jgi:hypothetical protein